MIFKPLLLAAIFAAFGLPVTAGNSYQPIPFSALSGWMDDDHAAALEAFKVTCGDMSGEDWQALCAVAHQNPNSRLYFETFFQPILTKTTESALFTGYYEPELTGSLTRTGRFRYPIYGVPDEVRAGGIWKTRRDIEKNELLKGRGLEIAWVENPADIFFLQIQGSGRLRLQDGTTIRLGYGGSNGHRYQAIGPNLVELGVLQEHEVSANRIIQWVQNNLEQGQEIIWKNSAYVFFRRVDDVPGGKGPLGAMNRSLTTLRTLAVDPKYVTLGMPIWLEKGGSRPLNRLMIAQDTGSAITGPQRADVFFGTGSQAGIAAGLTKDTGCMILLMPIEDARALVLEH